MHRKKQLFIPLLLCAVWLTACASLNLVSLKYENGMLINTAAGLAYQSLPSSFEPVATEEEYAVYKPRDLILYTIAGMDPQQWLSEKYDGIASVFCAAELEIPTLATFGATKMIVCLYEEVTLGLAEITDAEVIAQAVNLFENGEEAEWPLMDSKGLYQIKFASDTYPGLYYNLSYGIFEEGTFLYDRSSKKCVNADHFFDAYIQNSAYNTKIQSGN